jgi:dTDP-4-amino-4,6-dideoxygalactose transaminase
MKLAINGGYPVRTKFFPSQNTMGIEEKEAAIRVIDGGRLSGYRANEGSHFYGGPEIIQFEEEIKEKFKVKHAIACNSATSGLFIAYAAIKYMLREKHNLTPLVTPWSMTCSATIPLWFNDIPKFIDVEKDCFCIDNSLLNRGCDENKIIIAVSLFGQPYNKNINNKSVYVIEDAAQAIGSYYVNGNTKKYAGTLGDVGIFSFNFGKHITCGEGGMILTNNGEIALRSRLIMNHAESVINDNPRFIMDNSMFGLNLRMTELQAAVVRVQLKKFDALLTKRMRNVNYLQKRLKEIPPISIPKERQNCTHSYYVLPLLYDLNKANGIHRDVFINAVKVELAPRRGRDGEGVPIGCGYIKPIYRMPLFNIQKNLCPNTERLWRDEFFLTLLHAPNSTLEDMKDVADAVEKVWDNRKELL